MRLVFGVTMSFTQLTLEDSSLFDSFSKFQRVVYADFKVIDIASHCLDKVLEQKEVRLVTLSELFDLLNDGIDQFWLLNKH